MPALPEIKLYILIFDLHELAKKGIFPEFLFKIFCDFNYH